MQRWIVPLAVAVVLAGCADATVDKRSVRATQTAPESTQVAPVVIPYDPAYPRWVLTVEPLRFETGGEAAGGTPTTPGVRYGWGPFGWGILPTGPQAEAYNPPPAGAPANMGGAIAAQLVTALGNAGNVVVIDWDYYRQHAGKPQHLIKKEQGELGPFVIRGSVTEFNEIAEASGSSTGGSLGGLGAALGVAGAIAGSRPAAITGAAVGLANPTYENTVARRTGQVAMDLTIVDPQSGRIAGTVEAHGSFSNESAANGFSLFGFGKASNAYAASALGQASRAAMNSATTQIVDRLKVVR